MDKKDQDKITLKQNKGTWKRFIRLFLKCPLPWVCIIVYFILEISSINVGLDQTDLSATLFSGDTSPAVVTKLIIVLVINLVLNSLVVFAREVTSARINRNMRKTILNKVLRLPMSYFKDENPRDGVYRIVRNAIVIDSTIMVVIVPIILAAYKSFAVFFKIFKHDVRLSLILLAFVPFQILVGFIFGRINFFLAEREAYLNSNLVQKLSEIINMIPLAKAFAKEEKEYETAEEIVERLYKVSIKGSWMDILRDGSNSLIAFVRAALMVGVGYFLLKNNMIETRSWIAFFLFSGVFTGAIEEFMMYWNNLKIIQGGADKVAEIMDLIQEDLSGEECTELYGDIVMKDVHFAYDEEEILKGMNCVFKDHQINALVGNSGCGKTTMINLINRMYDLQEGSILIQDKNINDYGLDSYREKFVFVSQNSMIFSGTIRDNIVYGYENVSDEQIIKALKQARAYDFVFDLKEGLDTKLTEYGNNLSGGQKQRLALARALLSDAHYLILDEPTASMDAIAVKELLEVIQDIAKERCVILIAHDAKVLSIVSHVVIVEEGKASYCGALEEAKDHAFLARFMRKEAVYE